MPNYIKYSTNTQTLALKSGNYYIGTGDVRKGPTSTTDYWSCVIPPTSGYTVYLNKASNGPSIYTCNDDTDLINITNRIASQSYTSATECLVYYLGQNDKLCANIDYPSIVTNGLVFNLDAGFVPSYPRTATTWSDLSSNGNNGTLTNGPTFNSENGGSIVFDGTNDYGVITNPSILRNQSFTVSIWVNPSVQTKSIVSMLDFNHATSQGWVLQSENANTNRNYYFAWNDGTTFQPVNGFGFGIGIQLTNSVWQNIVFTKTGTTLIGYRNGSQVFTPSAASNSNVNYQNNNNLNIATWFGTGSRQFGGRISNIQIYNRALSATEVLQNYNATKARYIPNIVTNGLVLNLDAGDTESYPGTGTAWTDLSGNGNNATMFGNVPFQTDVAPCFDFASATGANASTSSLGFTFGSNMIPTTGNFTLSCWVKNPNASSSQVGLFSNSVSGNGYRFGVYQSGIYWLIGPNYAEGNILFSSAISSSLWYNVVAVFSRTTAKVLMYVNGTYQNQASTSVTQTAFTNTTPGLVRSACCSIYKGKLGIFSAYNRSLTAEEIAQNFNATRSRFGL